MEREIATLLLENKAVFLSPNAPFTWASGIQSPIYCDNRMTLAYPRVRDRIEEGLVQLIQKHYPHLDAVIGTATAGIAHAAIVADKLQCPMGYVRTANKDHGRKNQIEGFSLPGARVVVVEDLISTAGSVIEIVDILREAKMTVLGIVSIFTYGLQKGIERLKKAGIANHSLSNFDILIQVASEKGFIELTDIAKCIAFQKDPENPNWRKDR
ncbi:MAG: orotate phosphoribosyltransferase [Candidatus Izemoplasmatales bacterium]|jgi:orotate phosphoribosyltransferase